jgi:LPXTG-motif cell wall-anchored protein
MAINTSQVVNEAISYAVITDKDGLVALLERNGIQMPNNPSDNEVTTAILMANASSGTFRNDLATYLGKQIPKASEELSFTGVNFGFTGLDDFAFDGYGDDDDGFENIFGLGKKSNTPKAPKTPKVVAPKLTAAQKKTARIDPITNPQGKTKVGLALASVGGALKDTLLDQDNINAGLQIGLQAMANKTQAKQNALQTQALELQGTQDSLRQNLPNKGKTNTMTYVWVGVGVIAVALLGFVIYKRTKNN